MRTIHALVVFAVVAGLARAEVPHEDRLEAERLTAQAWPLLSQQQFVEAERLFQEAVQKDPGSANAWNGLGWSRFNQGNALNAQEAFERCLQLEPAHPAALNGLGWVAKGRGATDEAVAYWQKAIAADPRATAALSGLAATSMERGRHEEAVTYYQQWLTVEPASDVAREGLAAALAGGAPRVETLPAPPPAGIPELLPAPWRHGEALRFSLKAPTGVEIGTVLWEALAVRVEGREAWQIDQRMALPINNTFQFTRVVAEQQSFQPLGSVTESQLGRFRARYADGNVKVTAGAQGQTSSRDIDLRGPAYDNEQALYVIRRLPLAPGFEAAFPIFPVQGGSVVQARVAVTGQEPLAVPAGRFDCYRIDLAVYSGAVKALAHTLWVSTDAPRALIKYDAGQVIMELESRGESSWVTPTSFAEEDTGVRMSAPKGWAFYRNPTPGQYKLAVQILPPQLEAWAAFHMTGRTGDALSARVVAEKDIEVLKQFFVDYTVRPERWSLESVGGMEAATFSAAYRDGANEMVEYRTYIVDSTEVYWFVFRVEKSRFDSLRPAFDAVVRSFTVS